MLILWILVMGFNIHSQGQNAYRKWGWGWGYSFRDFGVPATRDFNARDFEGALQLQLNHYLNASFDAGLVWGFTPVNFGNPRKKEALTDMDLQLRYKLNNGYMFREMAPIAPYLLLGLSSSIWKFDDPNLQLAVPLGVGLKLQWEEPLSLDLNATYKPSLTDFDDYWTLNGALVINFGKGKKQKDRDQDGLADEVDLCPDIAGSIANNGCPDSDGDGIVDRLDDCPNEAGVPELAGCPRVVVDTDKDGVPDPEDKCPQEKGPITLGGCPDTDGDGIADHMDDCPSLPGLMAFGGCPDRDGDGVIDPEDACPDMAGSVAMEGCPDIDNDGISDPMDKCPELAGTPALQGCPEIEEEEQAQLDLAVREVRFNSGSSLLQSSSHPVLDQIGTILEKYPGYSLRIAGHTDAQGDADRNQLLSEARAKACADYLVAWGIDPMRIKYTGYGETRPIADNLFPEGRTRNRRVTFELFIE